MADDHSGRFFRMGKFCPSRVLAVARSVRDDGSPENTDTSADYVPVIRTCFLDQPQPEQRRQDIDSSVGSVCPASHCVSICVSARAKQTSETTPGGVQSGLL